MPQYQEPTIAMQVGVARGEITPPEGSYARNWGAAVHNTAEGVHRPLTATVLVLQAEETAPPLVLVSADLGWWQDRDDEAFVRSGVLEALALPASNVLLCLTHTHAGPSLCRAEGAGAYLDQLRATLAALAVAALAELRPAILTVGVGACTLAVHRDFPDPDQPERFLTGFHPDGPPADSTLLVGRITDPVTGVVRATLVNYACHPTTLGPTNRQISPDFVGEMRAIVEAQSDGAPCLFLQGASGELAPQQQYVSDTSVADAYGRCLGHSVLSTLAGMLPPSTVLRYKGMLSSGAPLALWEQEEQQVLPANGSASLLALTLPLKPLLSRAELLVELGNTCDTAAQERLRRRIRVRESVGDGATFDYPLWVWTLGLIRVVAHPGEAYSALQTTLRAAFPHEAVFVVNVANGHYGYLPPADLYSQDLYSVWQTPLAAGCLEAVIAASVSALGAAQAEGGTPDPADTSSGSESCGLLFGGRGAQS